MKNDNQKKNVYQFLVVFSLMFLFLSIPLVSAGWWSDTVSKAKSVVSRVVNAVKNVVNKVFNRGGSSSSGGSSQNSNVLGGGNGGSSGGNDGGNNGGTKVYNPWGSGSMPDPVVKQDPT